MLASTHILKYNKKDLIQNIKSKIKTYDTLVYFDLLTHLSEICDYNGSNETLFPHRTLSS